MKRILKTCLLLFVVFAPAASSAYNKMRRMDFKWQILRSDHFDLYYYPEEEALALRAMVLAEKAYQSVGKVLEYYPKARTPLFIYRNHVEFQQTNISRGVIGPGTGGFTEAFKNRVVLPTTGSDRWLETVITHEYVHALQFNILYGEGTRSFHVFKNYVIPLWMMEGMAEYAARNWDNYADMVMRDAVINQRLPDLYKLDGFGHLQEVYLAYKAGQTAVQFLSDRYGKAKIPALMKKFKAQISVSQVIRDLTGRSFGHFNREWRASLNQKYWLQIRGKKDARAFGGPLTYDNSEYLTINNGAAWSPDGEQVAFVSTRGGREQIWTVDNKGQKMRLLFAGPFAEIGRSGGYGVSGNRLSWSPDGKYLAFVVVKGGKKRLAIGRIKGERVRYLDLPFDDLAAPAWSPDGDAIAFSGSNGGDSEIYTVSPDGQNLAAVTSGRLSSLTTDPSWSRDGSWIVFSGEVERRNRVYIIRPDGGERRQISRDGEDAIMPDFDVTGRYVFYSSDQNGIYNLQRHDLDAGETIAITDVKGGLFQPRVSPDGRDLIFISYEDGCQNLYRMEVPGFVEKEPTRGIRALINPYEFQPDAEQRKARLAARQLTEEEVDLSGAEPPDDAMGLPQLAGGEDGPNFTTHTASTLPVLPYKLKITPDLFFMLVGYDSLNGLVGGGYLTGSDMLGNHNLSAFVNFVPGFQSVAQVDYVFAKKPVTTGLAAFYRNTNYFLRDINPQQFLTTFHDQDFGLNLFFRYPLSVFSRVDWGVGSRYLQRELEENTTLDPEVQVTLGESIINNVSISLSHETMLFRNWEPYSGHLLNIATSYSDRFLGGTRNFVFHQLQYRGALPLPFISRDAVLSTRAVGIAQTGTDRYIFYFGGTQVRGLSYTHTLKQQFASGSVELRHPYLKDINGRLWPLNFFLIKDLHLVFFYDFGVAANSWEGLRQEDVRGGWGGGFRLHTFAFDKVLFNWRFDIAQRTDRPDETFYYFTLGQVF